MTKTVSTMPAEIAGEERHVYSVGADRARKAYRTKHGAAVTLSLAERRSWNAAHADGMAAAAMRGGMTAVRKLHTTRVEMLATMTRADRIGGPASGEYLASLERDAAHAAARLEVLAAVDGKRTAPRKLASVPDVTPEARPEAAAIAKLRRGSKLAPCERHAGQYGRLSRADRFRWAIEGGMSDECEGGACVLTPGTDIYAADFVAAGAVRVDVHNGMPWTRATAAEVPAAPDYVDCFDCGTRDYPGESHTCEPREAATPETVPAPMPAMTRAARKATRREIAASLRAAGVKPEGDAWRDACRAAGLPVADEVNA